MPRQAAQQDKRRDQHATMVPFQRPRPRHSWDQMRRDQISDQWWRHASNTGARQMTFHQARCGRCAPKARALERSRSAGCSTAGARTGAGGWKVWPLRAGLVHCPHPAAVPGRTPRTQGKRRGRQDTRRTPANRTNPVNSTTPPAGRREAALAHLA